MTFMRPLDLTDAEERPGYERALQGAKASGTPFLSFFAPDEIVALAKACGFCDVQLVGADLLNARYFAGRAHGLRTSNAEEMIVAAA